MLNPTDIIKNLIVRSRPVNDLLQITNIEFCIGCNCYHYYTKKVFDDNNLKDENIFYLRVDAFKKANQTTF